MVKPNENSKNIKKAVYYGRVSTEEQAINGYSLNMQKTKCIEWANSNNYQIVEFFEDRGKSGADYKKLKSLQALNTYIRKVVQSHCMLIKINILILLIQLD